MRRCGGAGRAARGLCCWAASEAACERWAGGGACTRRRRCNAATVSVSCHAYMMLSLLLAVAERAGDSGDDSLRGGDARQVVSELGASGCKLSWRQAEKHVCFSGNHLLCEQGANLIRDGERQNLKANSGTASAHRPVLWPHPAPPLQVLQRVRAGHHVQPGDHAPHH